MVFLAVAGGREPKAEADLQKGARRDEQKIDGTKYKLTVDQEPSWTKLDMVAQQS